MNAGSDRTLYLHTGIWKTGSTALQAHLNFNSPRLAELGVSYEFHPDTNRGEGNGTYLSRQLRGRHLPADILTGMLEVYFAGRRIALCSSENFTSFAAAEWEQLRDAAAHLGLQIRTITYLRDLAPYYQSVHAQAFKGGERCCDLATYCRTDHYSTVMSSLRSLFETFGRDRMTVVRYESVRKSLAAPLMLALSMDPGLLDGTMLSRRINRTLTNYEMKVVTRLIEKTGQQFANELSNLLLSKRPDLEPDSRLDPASLQILKDRHSEDVKWINETFFDGVEVMRIEPTENNAPSAQSSSDAAEQGIDKDVAEWCIKKIATIQDSAVAFIAAKLANIDWTNIGDPLMPLDFDPIAYLILNVDVLKAGVPPCAHYISSGRHDPARKWKWENR